MSRKGGGLEQTVGENTALESANCSNPERSEDNNGDNVYRKRTKRDIDRTQTDNSNVREPFSACESKRRIAVVTKEMLDKSF